MLRCPRDTNENKNPRRFPPRGPLSLDADLRSGPEVTLSAEDRGDEPLAVEPASRPRNRAGETQVRNRAGRTLKRAFAEVGIERFEAEIEVRHGSPHRAGADLPQSPVGAGAASDTGKTRHNG